MSHKVGFDEHRASPRAIVIVLGEEVIGSGEAAVRPRRKEATECNQLRDLAGPRRFGFSQDRADERSTLWYSGPSAQMAVGQMCQSEFALMKDGEKG